MDFDILGVSEDKVAQKASEISQLAQKGRETGTNANQLEAKITQFFTKTEYSVNVFNEKVKSRFYAIRNFLKFFRENRRFFRLERDFFLRSTIF